MGLQQNIVQIQKTVRKYERSLNQRMNNINKADLFERKGSVHCPAEVNQGSVQR